MRTADLDYHLPEHLIATHPADRRDAARLLVATDGRPPRDLFVHDLPSLLQPGDLLVFNDTRVLPARFFGTRADTGGKVEGLYVETDPAGCWRVLLESRGKLQPGERIQLDDAHALQLIERRPDASWRARLDGPLGTEALLEAVGRVPLPPYIRKARGSDADADEDRRRYQTVYASDPGAVAAPTAGLHFTPALLDELQAAGVASAYLTLHVGLGTFAPVRAARLEDHAMHAERFTVPAKTLEALRRARHEGRRIIPVGTTCVRALESLPEPLPAREVRATTTLMIQPNYKLRFVDGLMTNFHLPRSTLLALVAARVGLERLRELYAHAVASEYRFYSYGDAMLVLPPREG